MLTFDAAAHVYALDGIPVPSVTQILKRVIPTDFSAIPAHVLERKRQVGDATHLAIDLYLRGELDESTLHPAVQPYFESWLKWFERGAEIIHSESKVHSPLGYAGTLDCLCEIATEPWVIDWKTTASPARNHSTQTAAYALCLPDFKGKRGALYLDRNGGSPILVQHDDEDYADWLAVLRVYHLMENSK